MVPLDKMMPLLEILRLKQHVLSQAYFHLKNNSPMNSATGSCSPSVRIVPTMLSFSRMGKNSWTKSEVYGGVITSRTCPKLNGDEKTNLRLNDTDVIYEETATQINQRPDPHLCDKVSDE